MTNKTENTPIIAYKGFDENWQCRGYQYEIGKSYEHKGKVEACESGFHACEYPLNVFDYYEPAKSKFALVEMSGEIAKEENGDTKISAAKIHIKAELRIPDLVNSAVEWIKSKIDWDNASTTNTGYRSAATNTGERSAAINTGERSAAINTGERSAAINTGDRSAATNTGDWSAATNTGYRSAATNTGDRSAATNTGYRSAATNTGDRSAATNTGYRSAAINTGDRSAATNTGYRSAATNTGDRSAATNTGDWSAAINTGDRSAATVEGSHSVAVAIGYQSKAKASASGAIVCVYRNDNGELIHIRASKVGENGVKPDTFYTLDENGNFIEVEE